MNDFQYFFEIRIYKFENLKKVENLRRIFVRVDKLFENGIEESSLRIVERISIDIED